MLVGSVLAPTTLTAQALKETALLLNQLSGSVFESLVKKKKVIVADNQTKANF